MEEYEVNAEPIIVDAQSALSTNESKIITQFQKEVSEMLDKRLLQIRFGVFILKVEKFEDERML